MAPQGIKVKFTDSGITLWLGFMAFLTSVSAAGVMSDVLGPKGSALMLSIVGGLQAGTAVVNARIGPIERARVQGSDQAHSDIRAARLRMDP